MTTQFRNLIFEGGGVKGIAYIGAMQILHNRGILPDIRRVGGTSAGAINALLFALGYTIPEQKEILQDTNSTSTSSWTTLGESFETSGGSPATLAGIRATSSIPGWAT